MWKVQFFGCPTFAKKYMANDSVTNERDLWKLRLSAMKLHRDLCLNPITQKCCQPSFENKLNS